MSVSELPYRIKQLERNGQYAYLSRPVARKKTEEPSVAVADGGAVKEEGEKKVVIRKKREKFEKKEGSKLRVLRNVTLCDGPTLWQIVKQKESEPYEFFVSLRLFATRQMVNEYLSGPEIESFCEATGCEKPSIKEGDIIISETSYSSPNFQTVIFEEYKKMILHRDSLDDLMKQFDGLIEDEKQQKKRKTHITLKEQMMLVQSTPSRVIDVSSFGETMKQQKGKILDRVRHAPRISRCVVLNDLFPVISDNLIAFERAMNMLGSRYLCRIAEFKAKQNSQQAAKA